jgi:hypothetical protein
MIRNPFRCKHKYTFEDMGWLQCRNCRAFLYATIQGRETVYGETMRANGTSDGLFKYKSREPVESSAGSKKGNHAK